MKLSNNPVVAELQKQIVALRKELQRTRESAATIEEHNKQTVLVLPSSITSQIGGVMPVFTRTDKAVYRVGAAMLDDCLDFDVDANQNMPNPCSIDDLGVSNDKVYYSNHTAGYFCVINSKAYGFSKFESCEQVIDDPDFALECTEFDDFTLGFIKSRGFKEVKE